MDTEVAGVVLAAGESKRFGGRKQLAPYLGKPLLRHVVDTMNAYCGRVIVVLGSGAAEVRAAADLRDADCVRCKTWPEGTFASLSCGLRALGSDWTEAIVVLGDQPTLTVERIDAVRSASGPIVRALADGNPSHPVVIRRGTAVTPAALRSAPGIELGPLPDIDTRSDLAAAEARARSTSRERGG